MALNQVDGRSAYCQEISSNRPDTPLYAAVRQLVNKYSSSGRTILDLGCSNLKASGLLAQDGFSVIGLDHDISALRIGQKTYPQKEIMLVQTDVTHLPFDFNHQPPFHTVLALDILEHLSRTEAVQLLTGLSGQNRDVKIIVSMPVISPWALATIKEFLEMKIKGKRPELGLFDRTHQILTDQAEHRRLFHEAGLRIVEEHQTDILDGVTGDWSFKNRRKPNLIGPKAWIKSFLSKLPEDFRKKLTVYQGLYVLENYN